MKPVFQTIIDRKIGNCFSAAIASLLELPLENVPNFVKDHGDRYMDAVQEWLQPRGLMLLQIRMPKKIKSGEDIRFTSLPECFCIGDGWSPRGDYGHSVVGKIVDGHRFQMIHDPHPSGAGLQGPPWCLEFVVLRDPAVIMNKDDNEITSRCENYAT